eukprot:CAMPEP_0202911162 /NCGR_PEP_ID=MMETSP1392-20130828/54218_1 /ASSEMBLY_ACC=CAM_ASM_000868 /TAXON_ID=225041 /ORGANISM="Chlamydomonas chlamydogama, Strain SAG 11-48b" /LENGTH=188 /DNA_ID=CAMNT_0049601563 /DNA_START=71 /DNA_END=637 /DNA_ORIENTATION=-
MILTRAVTDTQTYVEQLADAEVRGDVLRAAELFTEIRVLKLDLPQSGVEAGIRTYAASVQHWQRSLELFEDLLSKGCLPHADTTEAVFQSLSQSKQGTKAHQLLQRLADQAASSGAGRGGLSSAYNLVVRALAKEGALDSAVVLLEDMVASDGEVECERSTYAALANELIKAGQQERAEEVLEMRDYL